MARVELLSREQAPLLARAGYEGGWPGPIAAALAGVPELMEVVMPMLGAVYGPTSVAERSKEIVVLRVSSAGGCTYCTETHTRVAARMGFAADELAALRGEAPAPPRWTPAERALLDFSVALCTRPESSVPCIEPHFAEHQVVELVTLGAATVFLNRFAIALDLPV